MFGRSGRGWLGGPNTPDDEAPSEVVNPSASKAKQGKRSVQQNKHGRRERGLGSKRQPKSAGKENGTAKTERPRRGHGLIGPSAWPFPSLNKGDPSDKT